MAASSNNGAAVRAAAARAVVATLGGRNLGTAISEAARDIPVGRDRALLQSLAYGTIRHHRWLQAIASRLLRDPASTPADITALVEVGLHQLRDTRVPSHAAVSATVSATATLGQPGSRAVVNAVLRRYQREALKLEASLPGTPALRYSFPDWLAQRIKRDWPPNWRQIMAACNEPGPMTLRINQRVTTRAAIQAEFQAAGIIAHEIAGVDAALRLEAARSVSQIPGFDNGQLSVQDAAAQLAASVLDARPGMRVLDACAAPGGKTAHLLESVDNLDLLAIDNAPHRLQRIRDNLERLQLHATIRCADASQPKQWWDNKPFDRILLDAPCSGSGVIRRHPDIKWLRRNSDIPHLAAQQKTLLDALWPLLAPGGVLVYATCSVLEAEGPAIIAGFLRTHPDAHEKIITADWGQPARVGRRIAPGGDWDGFYYACLQHI